VMYSLLDRRRDVNAAVQTADAAQEV